MNKLAISAIASLLLTFLLASSAMASPLSGVHNGLRLAAAMNCGCKKQCCETKCCKPKCCKPKCCETKCCKPKCETNCCESNCCKKKCCCPAEPVYPEVCAHNHADLERDLVSRKHAPWQ